MEHSLIVRTSAVVIALVLGLTMLTAFFLGRMVRRTWKLDELEPKGGVGMIQTSLFALFGFILAFAFGMSGQRFDSIRSIYTKEAQDFGTALLRADLYSDSVRNVFRSEFKNYLEARINTYSDVLDTAKTTANLKASGAIEGRLWKLATDESKHPNMLIPSNQMLPALNSLFDTALQRDITLKSAVPDTIVYMLLILGLVSSFVAGITTTSVYKKDWLIIACFILFSSLVVYTTLDLGRPLRGIIRANTGELAIKDLRKMFY